MSFLTIKISNKVTVATRIPITTSPDWQRSPSNWMILFAGRMGGCKGRWIARELSDIGVGCVDSRGRYDPIEQFGSESAWDDAVCDILDAYNKLDLAIRYVSEHKDAFPSLSAAGKCLRVLKWRRNDRKSGKR